MFSLTHKTESASRNSRERLEKTPGTSLVNSCTRRSRAAPRTAASPLTSKKQPGRSFLTRRLPGRRTFLPVTVLTIAAKASTLAVENEGSSRSRHQHLDAKRSALSPATRRCGEVRFFSPCTWRAFFLAPQNLYEFWVVATRPPGENGLGMTTELAQARLTELKRSFGLLEDRPALFTTWETLVTENGVTGKSAHDARLVAAMKVADLEAILTFNKNHFTRYSGITVLTPDDAIKNTQR